MQSPVSTWVDVLDEAIEAASGVAPDGPLRSARSWLSEPLRIVVFGRVAAGKTTFINGVVGDDGPTGLGGVTEAPREVGTGLWIHVDTPGIDDPDRAIVDLQPLMDQADAAVWVVDGLQPLTASERDVASVLLGDVQLSIVITKADLVEEAERNAILDRVRTLTDKLVPIRIDFVNARQLEAVPSLSGPPLRLSPRRRRILADAESAMRDALPEPPLDRAAIEALWARAVREQVETIDHAIDRGAIRNVGGAVRALNEAAEPARRALRAAVPGWLLPVMPAADTEPGRLATSGPDQARRVVVAACARWLAEGQLTLREWWVDAEEPAQEAARYQRLVRALDQLRELVAVL